MDTKITILTKEKIRRRFLRAAERYAHVLDLSRSNKHLGKNLRDARDRLYRAAYLLTVSHPLR